uniref:F-box/LRR-repeat protein 15-like leucin rich repeat domain-containing protein n=1 Tax=Kalanchoe fedtschenkoi TaxID=63787 RepID=A0A7N0REQ3_KALFE
MLENLNPNFHPMPSSPTTPLHLRSTKPLRRLSRNRPGAKPPPLPPLPAPFDSVPDQVVIRVFMKLSESQRKVASLVCKRWLGLQSRLVESVRVLDWGFLESGRLVERFKDLRDVDLADACVKSNGSNCRSVVLSWRSISVDLSDRWVVDGDRDLTDMCSVNENLFLSKDEVDEGLTALSAAFPRLRKLVTVAGTEMGLLSVAERCVTLQELELRRCCDNTLRAIAAFENLQVLRLVGNVGECDTLDGRNCSGNFTSVTDIGLTILAQGCKRLVELELSGCEGSYDGVKAVGQCCQMLEELTLTDHKLDDGWLAGLSYCQNLKNLSLRSCKKIDDCPGPEEYLGCCPSLERLHLEKCQLRSSEGLKALLVVCDAVREIVLQDCWVLGDDMFILIRTCRRVSFLSLEGCSLITTAALESVALSLGGLERLRVVSCKNVKNSEVSPALSALFTVLQELKWMPDAKSLLSSNFTSLMGKRGGKFFKK